MGYLLESASPLGFHANAPHTSTPPPFHPSLKRLPLLLETPIRLLFGRYDDEPPLSDATSFSKLCRITCRASSMVHIIPQRVLLQCSSLWDIPVLLRTSSQTADDEGHGPCRASRHAPQSFSSCLIPGPIGSADATQALERIPRRNDPMLTGSPPMPSRVLIEMLSQHLQDHNRHYMLLVRSFHSRNAESRQTDMLVPYRYLHRDNLPVPSKGCRYAGFSGRLYPSSPRHGALPRRRMTQTHFHC